MKIAIHHRSGSFSNQWIKYCEEESIPYKLVNAYDNNIIDQIKGYNIFLWHFSHFDFKDNITAKRILHSVENQGINVYPDFNTCWHFDDKVAQKYLLEAIEAPLVNSFVFYDKESALKWANETSYPKVWKLKGGAGASNVKLVRNKKECIARINKSFGRGYPQFDKINHLIEKWKKFLNGKNSSIDVLKAIGRLIIPSSPYSVREIGYVYFQEFIPNNKSDLRVVVIHSKYAAAERRFVRENDFRASGSGEFSYENINLSAIKIAFNISKKLKMQTVAFDFIFDEKNNPLIVEISFGFGFKGISNVPGYWDSELNRINKTFIPQNLIIEGLIR